MAPSNVTRRQFHRVCWDYVDVISLEESSVRGRPDVRGGKGQGPIWDKAPETLKRVFQIQKLKQNS